MNTNKKPTKKHSLRIEIGDEEKRILEELRNKGFNISWLIREQIRILGAKYNDK